MFAGDAVQKEIDAKINKENSPGNGQHAVPVINVTRQAIRVEILVVHEVTTPDTEERKIERRKGFVNMYALNPQFTYMYIFHNLVSAINNDIQWRIQMEFRGFARTPSPSPVFKSPMKMK